MKLQKHERQAFLAAQTAAAAHNCTASLLVHDGGTHLRIQVVTQDGNRGTVTVASSPRDKNVAVNYARQQTNRLCKALLAK